MLSTLPALVIIFSLGAPVQTDSAQPLDRGYAAMYNLDFSGAHRSFQEWETAHPDDPMGPVSDAAAYLFAEFDRLKILHSEFLTQDDRFSEREQRLQADPASKRLFNAALDDGQSLAKRIRAKSPNDRNALLAAVLARGLHADYLALIEKRNLAGLSEMKESRLLAERLLKIDPQCYDAYLSVGAENYLLSLKPAPIRWMLRVSGAETDKAIGIKHLQLVAEKGHYLLPYAKLLLAVASLRDHDLATARAELTWLASHFPSNRLYREELKKIK